MYPGDDEASPDDLRQLGETEISDLVEKDVKSITNEDYESSNPFVGT